MVGEFQLIPLKPLVHCSLSIPTSKQNGCIWTYQDARIGQIVRNGGPLSSNTTYVVQSVV